MDIKVINQLSVKDFRISVIFTKCQIFYSNIKDIGRIIVIISSKHGKIVAMPVEGYQSDIKYINRISGVRTGGGESGGLIYTPPSYCRGQKKRNNHQVFSFPNSRNFSTG